MQWADREQKASANCLFDVVKLEMQTNDDMNKWEKDESRWKE